MFWDMEEERAGRVRGLYPALRGVARAARWELQRPILDGPFTETKEFGVGRSFASSPGRRPRG